MGACMPGTMGQRGRRTASDALLPAPDCAGVTRPKRRRLNRDRGSVSKQRTTQPQELGDYSGDGLPSHRPFILVEFSGPCDSKLEPYDDGNHPPLKLTDSGSGVEAMLLFRIFIPREFIDIVNALKPYCCRDVDESVIDSFVYTCRLIGEATSPGRMSFSIYFNNPEIEDFAIRFVQDFRQKYDELSSVVYFLKFYPPNSVNLIGGDSEIQTYLAVNASKSERTLLLFFSGIRHYLEKIFDYSDEGNVELLLNHMMTSGEALLEFRNLGDKIREPNFLSRGEAIINALWELVHSLTNHPCRPITMLCSLKYSVIHFVKSDVHRRSRLSHSNPAVESTERGIREALRVVLISQKMYQCAFLPSPPPSIRLVNHNNETIPF